MTKEYWITNSRFKLIAIILFLMFVLIMVLLYLKADEITKHPCEVCAKKIGDGVICYIHGGGGIITKEFGVVEILNSSGG